MGDLWFVGLGLADERGLSRAALDALRASAEVFAEEYTALAPPGTIERIAAEIGRPVRVLRRAELESEAPVLQALAGGGRIALLVVGDPFAATTHVALRLAAERAGHAWHYVPGPSILTAAAGFLGLSAYRFGRTVSLPFLAPGFRPRSPVEQLAANRRGGLHTLLLLDLAPEDGRFLDAAHALGELRELDPEGSTVPDGAEVAVVARIGREDARGWFAPFVRLRTVDFGPPPHAIVVPAPELHFEEAAALERFRLAPERDA